MLFHHFPHTACQIMMLMTNSMSVIETEGKFPLSQMEKSLQPVQTYGKTISVKLLVIYLMALCSIMRLVQDRHANQYLWVWMLRLLLDLRPSWLTPPITEKYSFHQALTCQLSWRVFIAKNRLISFAIKISTNLKLQDLLLLSTNRNAPQSSQWSSQEVDHQSQPYSMPQLLSSTLSLFEILWRYLRQMEMPIYKSSLHVLIDSI